MATNCDACGDRTNEVKSGGKLLQMFVCLFCFRLLRSTLAFRDYSTSLMFLDFVAAGS